MTTDKEKTYSSSRRIIAYIFIGAFLYFIYLLYAVQLAIPMLYAMMPVLVLVFGGALWVFYKGVVDIVHQRDDTPKETRKRALKFLAGDVLVISVSFVLSILVISLFET